MRTARFLYLLLSLCDLKLFGWDSYSLCVFFFQVLLGSELIKSSSEERSLLKNLGSWLGKITIGRNQVLRAREIDPKSLIIEVFLNGFFLDLLWPITVHASAYGFSFFFFYLLTV